MADRHEWILIEARWNEQGRLLLAHPTGGSTWVRSSFGNEMRPEDTVQHDHPGCSVDELREQLRLERAAVDAMCAFYDGVYLAATTDVDSCEFCLDAQGAIHEAVTARPEADDD